jgi:glutathione S-transferase
VQSYDLTLDAASAAYVQHLLGARAMREWYLDALKETFRDEPHEAEALRMGNVLEDLRAT